MKTKRPKYSATTLSEIPPARFEHVARIHTDSFVPYRGLARDFAGGHYKVNHSLYEYARMDGDVNTHINSAGPTA